MGFGNFKFPKETQVVEESRERPMVGPRSNRGFQDVMEEVSAGDDDSVGSEGRRPSLGSSEIQRAGGPPFCVFVVVSWPPNGLVAVFVVRAVGSVFGSSLSEPSADASSAEILIASSARRSM